VVLAIRIRASGLDQLSVNRSSNGRFLDRFTAQLVQRTPWDLPVSSGQLGDEPTKTHVHAELPSSSDKPLNEEAVN
jgi:hypothetical protein